MFVLDLLTEMIRDGERWESSFADDQTITTETMAVMQEMIIQWQESLQKGRLKVNKQKSEIMMNSKGIRENKQINNVRDEVVTS